MSKFFKYIAFAGVFAFGLGLASCSDDDGVTPSDVTNIRSEAGPGQITLRWDTPDDGTIKYVKVSYYDHLTKQNEVRLASIYADSIQIPDTRKKYGTYSFSVQSISPSGDGGAVQTIDAVSGIAPATTLYSAAEIKLTVDDLSSNAPEPSEGPIASLLDNNTGTFFHTAWSVSIPGPHWLQVNLNQTLTSCYKFYYAPRNNGSNKPTDFDLMGSTDGTNWFLIKKFTKEDDNLPVTATDTYTSPNLDVPQPFSYVKMVVNETNTGTVFWTMSEFKFYNVTKTVIDPEAPDVEE